jgi:hypothetical protein
MIDEELILYTLAQRMTDVRWARPGDPPDSRQFLTVSRRVVLFGECPQQPACYQAEHGDTVAQVTGMPYKTILQAKWIIYQNLAQDKNALGVVENNLIIQGCYAALAPRPDDPGFLDRRNTLGGLVYHCFIQGELFKDPGDLDGQGMMVIPIKVLVP